MNLREQFEKETGSKLINCNTEDAVLKYWIDYSKWLEQRNKEQLETIEFVLDKVDWGSQKFSVRVVCRVGLEKQLKKSGEL